MSRVDQSLGLIIVLLVPLVVLAGAAPVSAAPEGKWCGACTRRWSRPGSIPPR
jgi:hypothetical protein